MLKQLLDVFAHVHVQLVCALLNGCGKFLYYQSETRSRCDAMLTLLSKLRSVHRLPHGLLQLVDNAMYACKPPQERAEVVDERPPIQRYAEALVHTHLSKHSLEQVVRRLRKLPWYATAAETWVTTALLDCACVKYHAIALVACTASALYRYHEGAMLRLVDCAVERARCAVDRNDHREGQRRMCLMSLIGELYNYKLLDSSMIFRVLYVLVPRECGIWGRVMPLTHVPVGNEIIQAVTPSARARLPKPRVVRTCTCICMRMWSTPCATIGAMAAAAWRQVS